MGNEYDSSWDMGICPVSAHCHVVDRAGALVFDRLLDNGSNTLKFDKGGGFVQRYDLKKNGWELKYGWTK